MQTAHRGDGFADDPRCQRERFAVFIAAPSSELDRALGAIGLLGHLGIETTSRWVHHAERQRRAGISEADMSEQERAHIKAELLTDIERASHVWIMAPSEGHLSKGVWTELGIVLGLQLAGKPKHMMLTGDGAEALYGALELTDRYDLGGLAWLLRAHRKMVAAAGDVQA
jgi:hypothetical protein